MKEKKLLSDIKLGYGAGETIDITPKEKLITVKYHLGGWNEREWKGSVAEAMQIALGEIHEHAGGSSSAYCFTKAVFEALTGGQA